jgi:peptidyl-prolyl cis-trans isomerase SurA
MIVKKLQVFSIALLIGCTSFSLDVLAKGAKKDKNNPALFTIKGEPVLVNDFKYIYEKNNSNEKDKLYTEDNLRSYLDLFINFKLKIHAALDARIDTTENFKKEYTQYRSQLAQPYLIDRTATQKLIDEAYDRSTQEIRAAHILINVGPDDSQRKQDSALKVINRLRDSITKGADFEKVAKKFSQDPSAQYNGGDLGYFTSFQMIYAFESAAFELQKIGEISKPVKTQFGWHIILLKDRRKNRGEVHVRHILVNDNEKNTDPERRQAKQKIDSVYFQLGKGRKFEELAMAYSDHQPSKENGGEIGWFNSFATFPEPFMEAAFSLKTKGEYTKPFQTTYGWHILQLMDTRPVKTKGEMMESLKSKIQRDTRSEQSKEAAIEKFKVEYQLKEKKPEVLESFTAKVLDTTLLNGDFKTKNRKIPTTELFRLGDTKYTYQDFAKWLEKNQFVKKYKDLGTATKQYYKDYVNKTVIAYADSKLEDKYTEFRNISNEYKEGILLFDITDKNVWSKATADTVGQKALYTKNASKYVWGERVDAVIFDLKPNGTFKDTLIAKKTVSVKDKKTKKVTKMTINDTTYTEVKLVDAFKKMIGEGKSAVQVANHFNSIDPLFVNIKTGLFESGENKMVDKTNWQGGLWEVGTENGRVYYTLIRSKKAPEQKKYNEIKGVIISDYQDKLEKEWISNLKQKYPVEIDEVALRRLIKK